MKREVRQPTQIEIMAAVEREKQAKKAERKAAKVRAHTICLYIYLLVRLVFFLSLEKSE